MKLWFGVSKFASTSPLVYAVEWEKASDPVRTSHETRTALGPVSMSNYTICHVGLISRLVSRGEILASG